VGEEVDRSIADTACSTAQPTTYAGLGTDHYDKKDPTKLIAPSKPKPRYYAEHTVARAMVHLGMTRQDGGCPQPTGSTTNAEIEPSR
jgi:hypothetical protein